MIRVQPEKNIGQVIHLVNLDFSFEYLLLVGFALHCFL